MAQLVTGADALDAFLAHYGPLPWSPGYKVDCCLALAEWAMWLGHPDPASHLRGTYDSDDGFRAIIAAHQGVSPLVAGCVAQIGGEPVERPLRGDLGVIGSSTNIHRQFGALHDGGGWLVRTARGFERVCARTLRIWRIACRS